MKPLYILAEKGELTDKQTIDLETLAWIKKNAKPKRVFITKIYPNFKPLSIERFRLFQPSEEWFARRDSIQDIHGLPHILRVVIFSYILTQICQIKNYEPFLFSASIHDIQRLSDKEDKDHGKRAALWLKSNSLNIKNTFKKEEIRGICFAVSNHDKKDLNFSSKSDRLFLDVLKTADALDRFRLPKIKWWPDEQFIPFKLDPQIYSLAKFLVFRSEQLILNKKVDIFNSVAQAAMEVGILEKHL